MKLYYDSSTEPTPIVIDGLPPVDQSAEVAALTTQVATLTTERDAEIAINAPLRAGIAGARARAQARVDADVANVDGQTDLDALAGL